MTEKAKRIEAAIAECDRYIQKEAPRSADLRPADVQELLDFTISHKAKLEEMLVEEKAWENF